MKASNNKSKVRKSLTVISLKIFLLFSSTICMLFLGESFARYRLKAWPFDKKVKTYEYLSQKDDNLRWRYPPEGGRNSLGLRNKEIIKKGAHHYRILFLGDSMVYVGETSSGELYTQVIERNLNDEPSLATKQFEVINAGIPGYTTYQELEFLKTYALHMEPDLVVLGFVFNDVYYKYLHKPVEGKLLAMDPSIRLHRFNTRTFPGVLFAKSYLAHEAFYALANKIRGHSYFTFERRDDFYLAWKDYGWYETKTLIGEMQGLLKERNIQLKVIIFPIADQVDDKYLNTDRDYVLYPQQRIKSICNDYRIPFLDLTETLYRHGGAELSIDGLHLNVKGNDVVASEVTRYLIGTAPDWFNK